MIFTPVFLADKVSKPRYRPLRSQGYFSFSTSSPYSVVQESRTEKASGEWNISMIFHSPKGFRVIDYFVMF